MIPLIGAFPGLSSVEMFGFGYLVPSQVLVVVAGAIVLGGVYSVVSTRGSRGAPTMAVYVAALFLLMGFWGLASAWAFGGNWQRVVMQGAWAVAPVLFAGFLIGIAKQRGVCFSKLSEMLIAGMAVFSAALIAYNVLAYGFSFFGDRLYCPGLGLVILGYTNALVLALAVSRRSSNVLLSRPLMHLSVVVLLIATFLTGSRGGIYPALVLTLLYFLPRKNAASTVLFVLGALVIILAFNPVEAFLSGRTGSLQSGRYSTWASAFVVFCGGSPLDQLLGYGFGNLFPYQDWYTNYYTGRIERGYVDGAWNQFSFRGNTMLVEPHNTYVWLLLEGGVLSLIGFLLCVLSPLFRSVASDQLLKLRLGLVLMIFLILGLFDAVVLVNAAAAFWWGVVFVAVESAKESKGVVDCASA